MEITPKLREVARKYETPFVVLDLDLLKKNYERLRRSVKNAVIFYAVKANSHVSILETLKETGSCFDVASRGEIEKLLSLNINA
ncbi:MAG TPA: type III PLP-dependent enzyme, partial [Thermotogota bacterium]|nr:type III PLP-dependent enzyme [Thermotogota bacterium]